ncbi:hypothetical protein [Mucilaginibacter sp. UYCu711]|uniref:hypothetical protein n=1 Tax=Mucilaginibacter sp. UYCu711 TaxID=3156339 RepID=UPI003D22990B
MKKATIFTVLTLISIMAKAQYVHSAADQVNSLNWGIIDMIRFKRLNDTLATPIYSEEVKRFENRHFQLTGYMVPMKAGMKQIKFMISTLPINQCFFCGKNGNPIMVIVNADKPVIFTFKTVTVDGILRLGNGNAYYLPPVYLDNARLVE